MEASDLHELLEGAFKAARKDTRTFGEQTENQARSSRWVEAVAKAFRGLPAIDASVRVFAKHSEDNADFKISELLYDVLVARTATVRSSHQNVELPYVTEALWLIESEFANDGREALKDFQKLVIGRAPNKLFIGPHVSDPGSFIKVLLPAAKCCDPEENVFVALVPEPDAWDDLEDSDEDRIKLWKLDRSEWMRFQP